MVATLPLLRRSAAGVRPRGIAPAPACAQIRALYLHIPFCERKCAYCDFTSVGGVRGQRPYMEALCGEIRALAAALPGVVLDTVFVGGGTPSIVEPRLLAAVLGEVRSAFILAPEAEVTMEANPSSISEARAGVWLEAGINRVSVGVQALQPDLLAFLDRVHSAERALEAVAALRRAGVPRLSCDLIYAVPGLDDARWAATLERVLHLGLGHLSCYELTVEEGTPLAHAVERGETGTADPETALRQHWMTVDAAARAGCAQYEISNFARPGEECRHNLAYWRNQYYLAAGVGAHGHLPAAAAAALGLAGESADDHVVRWWHTGSIPEYVAMAEGGLLPVAGVETVGLEDGEAERILVGLRLVHEGIELRDPARLAEARRLAQAGLLAAEGTRWRLTRRGQEVLNAVALRLVAASSPADASARGSLGRTATA